MTNQEINNMRIEFKSLEKNVSLARIAVAAMASQLEVNLDELEEIKVAVSEAVSNAIIHGYGSQLDKTVVLEAALYPDGIQVTVTDQGIGIEDIKKAMEPSFSTDPERMGLGFVFMQSFADQVGVQSVPGEGTQVCLFKRIGKDGL
jgi:stage II sporulation protein AB (anti-sigma F factor)